MSTITTINASDQITNSRTDINTNFANLNADKFEISNVDTDTALAANSDTKVPSQKAIKAYVDALGSFAFTRTGMIMAYGASSAPTGYLLCDGSAVSRSTYSALLAIIGTSFGAGDGSLTFNVPDLRSRFIVGAGTAGTKVFTFSSRSTDTLTITGATNSSTNQNQTGQVVTYHTTSGVITGLVNDTNYYLIRIAYNQFKLASTLANAVAGTAISLSSDGSGTQTFTETLTARTVGDTGGEETHALLTTELPAHTHTATIYGSANSGTTKFRGSDGGGSPGSDTTDATGGSTVHNSMPPFVGVTYIIKT